MGTRFTRVTVVGGQRQIDVSLPSDAPVAEQLPMVLRLLSVPPAEVPVRWRLASSEFGPLEPSRSLNDIGVLDGTLLYLTEASAAPMPPFVDDVESAVAELVVDVAPGWTGEARRGAVGVLFAVLLVAALVTGLGAASPVSWIAPAVVLMAGLVAGGLIREPGGWLCALAAVPAAVALLLGVMAASPSALGTAPTSLIALSDASGWPGFPLALLIAAALALALVGVARRAPGVNVGGAVTAILAVGAFVCVRLGLPPDRVAGLALTAAVIVSGLAGQVALGGAGLVDLMVADERGEPVPRQSVVMAVRRGLGMAAGLVWAAAVIGAVACWVLIAGSQQSGSPAVWTAPVVGAIGGLIFVLRSRMFSRAQHVAPMIGVAVVALVAVAVRLPFWLSAAPDRSADVTLVVLAVIGLIVVVSGLGSVREVAGARLQRGLERLELVAVLALVPGLVLIFRVVPMVQRWWG